MDSQTGSQAGPGKGQDPRGHHQLADRQRRIGLLEYQLDIAESFQEVFDQAGNTIQRPRQDAGLTDDVAFGTCRAGDAGQYIQPILDFGSRAATQNHGQSTHQGGHPDEGGNCNEDRTHGVNPVT